MIIKCQNLCETLSVYLTNNNFSISNQNPETDIGVQTENQKSKAAKPLEKSFIYQDWATTD